MKKIWIVSSLIISMNAITNSAEAQNLVPNPSFEDTVACPDVYGQIDRSLHWLNFGNSPDYFNPCATNCVNVPNTCIGGYQIPYTGNAFAGFIVSATFPDTNYREFIGVQLTQPLQIGAKYYISFFVNKGTSQVYTLCSNKMGVKFSNTLYTMGNPPLLTNSADVFTDTIVKDTVGWFQIKGSFIANQNYQYLILGNFFDDNHTDTTGFGSYPRIGYYFLDEVCVSTDSVLCYTPTGLNVINKKKGFEIFPNPADDFLTIQSDKPITEIIIYNSLGQQIYNKCSKLTEGENKIYLKSFNEGLYILQIEKKFIKKFIINHKQ